MGYKTICLECRKTFNHGSDFEKFHIGNCPECGKLMLEIDQKFKAPKSSDDRKWETVKFLVNHGFRYQRISEIKYQIPFVKYPENLRDAKEFVAKYSDQALN
jgi:hypothetical protein